MYVCVGGWGGGGGGGVGAVKKGRSRASVAHRAISAFRDRLPSPSSLSSLPAPYRRRLGRGPRRGGRVRAAGGGEPPRNPQGIPRGNLQGSLTPTAGNHGPFWGLLTAANCRRHNHFHMYRTFPGHDATL